MIALHLHYIWFWALLLLYFIKEEFKEMWDYDQQMQDDEPGQVLLLKGGMYGDSLVR